MGTADLSFDIGTDCGSFVGWVVVDYGKRKAHDGAKTGDLTENRLEFSESWKDSINTIKISILSGKEASRLNAICHKMSDKRVVEKFIVLVEFFAVNLVYFIEHSLNCIYFIFHFIVLLIDLVDLFLQKFHLLLSFGRAYFQLIGSAFLNALFLFGPFQF